jgi:hypothetical protein
MRLLQWSIVPFGENCLVGSAICRATRCVPKVLYLLQQEMMMQKNVESVVINVALA